MPLTIEILRNAKPLITPDGRKTQKSYRISDSKGMYIEIAPSGGKWWRLKYRFNGKEKRISLGVYPNITLAMARKKRDAFRKLIKKGIDPSQRVKEEKAARRAEEIRQLAASRFKLESDGGLTLQLRNRCLALTPVETMELHIFLDNNRTKLIKEKSCL